MALTQTEEELLREFLEKRTALLSLASNEPTISSKLGGTIKTLDELDAVSDITDSDLMFFRQGIADRKSTASQFLNSTSFLSKNVQIVNDIATLRTIAPSNARYIDIKYHTSAEGGGDGRFRGVTGEAPATYVDSDIVLVPAGGDGSAAWIRCYDTLYDSFFGVIGGGVVDDTVALQKALDYGPDNLKTCNLVLAKDKYKITSGLTHDSYFTSIAGYCLIDASTLSSGAAITTFASIGADPAASYSRKGLVTGNIRLKGNMVAGVIGHYFNSATATSNPGLLVQNMAVFGFDNDLVFGDRAYNIVFVSCEYLNSNVAIKALNAADGGEKIVFKGCKVYNNVLAINNKNPNCALHFDHCSVDYNEVNCVAEEGRVFFDVCHIEADSYATPPFVTYPVNGATIKIDGGWMLCTGTNTSDIFESQTTENQGGGIFVDGVSMNNMGSGRWNTGTGRFTIDAISSYDVSNNPKLCSPIQNKLGDGGFELATVIDAFIESDTAAITARTVGANINLTTSATHARTGAKSLKAAKTFGGGSACIFSLCATLSKNQPIVNYAGYYKKPNAGTGDVYITHSFVKVVQDAGIDVVVKSLVVGTTSVTFTAAAVDWTLLQSGEPTVHAPEWATHYTVQVNMDGFVGPDDIYFDDFEIYEI